MGNKWGRKKVYPTSQTPVAVTFTPISGVSGVDFTLLPPEGNGGGPQARKAYLPFFIKIYPTYPTWWNKDYNDSSFRSGVDEISTPLLPHLPHLAGVLSR